MSARTLSNQGLVSPMPKFRMLLVVQTVCQRLLRLSNGHVRSRGSAPTNRKPLVFVMHIGDIFQRLSMWFDVAQNNAPGRHFTASTSNTYGTLGGGVRRSLLKLNLHRPREHPHSKQNISRYPASTVFLPARPLVWPEASQPIRLDISRHHRLSQCAETKSSTTSHAATSRPSTALSADSCCETSSRSRTLTFLVRLGFRTDSRLSVRR